MAYRPARTAQEFRDLAANTSDGVKIVRSRADWDATFAAADAGRRAHPLRALSDEEVAAFSDRLVFRNGALASAWVGDLADRLSYRDFVALWELFGIDASLMFDAEYKKAHTSEADFLRDYYCASHGTCSSSHGFYCTSSC